MDFQTKLYERKFPLFRTFVLSKEDALNKIKQLAGQTAIYGISSIVGRFINYLLVPLYTYQLQSTASYGIVTEMYAYVGLFIVLLTYGMETAFFRYSELEKNKSGVYTTSLISILISTAIFFIFIFILRQNIANILRYPDNSEFVLWFSLIISFDVISAIPFARLRAQHRAKRFVSIKLINIFIYVALNLFFIVLCPFLYEKDILKVYISYVYDGEIHVKYIFISNLISSSIQLLLLSPEFRRIKWQFDPVLWKKMILYALPLLVFGFAGVINEALDRILLKYLLPQSISLSKVGIYGACYKISIIMSIFIQAYRYAAEPFFFAQAKNRDAKETYAEVMKFFIIIVTLIFLGTMLYLDDIIIFFIGEEYRVGKGVIPILLMANLFLGVFYNLSIWYKLTNKTHFGAWISIIGVIITVSLNFYWIPRIGYMGSAWATFICYGSMMILSFFLGQKYYRVNYPLLSIFLYIGLSVLLYFISGWIYPAQAVIRITFNTFLLIIFLFVVFIWERKHLKAVRAS